MEAAASGADGPRVPLPAPHLPHRCGRRRASLRRAGARRRGRGRSRIAEGRGRSRQEGPPGAYGQEKAGPKAVEEVAEGEKLWDRRHIHTGFASATTSPGSRGGTPTAITPT